jgi:hypothetical protein
MIIFEGLITTDWSTNPLNPRTCGQFMSTNKGVGKIFFLTTILLLSSLFPLLSGTTTLELQKTSNVSPVVNVTTFTSGLSSTSMQSDMGGTAIIAHQSGHRLLNASVDVEVLPYSTPGVWFDTMQNAQAIGTLNNTSVIANGVQLQSANSGPPGSGNNSTMLFNAVQWSGSHSYDTLELRCGIASCGSITATGSLTILVRVLVVESGTSITASGAYSGGTAPGGSTIATSSGNSDGAGGAGHGGSGGSGGASGTGGGAAGSTYGNGTEGGSQGGSVTSSNHPTANGGYGGGYIRIIADQVHVNGTILSNGEDGTNGQAINGGSGSGGSGAGAGSGGSIFIKANEVNIGLNGAIQADGGDGGDGASSYCTGACIGFFHGGDGGGGGGGGRISIMTQISKYNNQGTVSVSGGTGGTGGQPYGTGSVGFTGSAGASGASSISTWTGYILSTGVVVDDGSFTTYPWSPNGGQITDGWVNHSASIPVNSSLIFTYRYTVSGLVNTTSSLWSDWNIGNITHQKLPRLTSLQFSYQFNRTGTSSPILNDLEVRWVRTHALTNIEMDLSSGVSVLGPSVLSLTSSTNATVMSSGNTHSASISLPVSSTPTSPLHLWVEWPSNSASDTIDIELGGATVYSGMLNSSLNGIDVEFSIQDLLNAWPSSGSIGVDGIESGELLVNISTTLATQIDVHHTQMSWSWTHTVDLEPSMAQYAFATCTDWYHASSSCLSEYNLHVRGDTIPFNFQGFTIKLQNLSLQWIDDIAPQISSVDHRIGLIVGDYIRVGDTFVMTVEDGIGDDSLSGSAWIHQGDSTKPTSPHYLSFFSGLNRYVTSFTTNEYDPLSTTQHYIAVELTDQNDNTLFTEQAYTFDIGPVAPSVTSLAMNAVNSTHTLSSESQSSQTWGLHEGGFEFSASALHNRSDFSASLTLTPAQGSSTVLPLSWDGNINAYSGIWIPERSDLGTWEVEVGLSESTGQQAIDADGYQNGVDLNIDLIDDTGPMLTSFLHENAIVLGEELLVQLEWQSALSEVVDGFVTVEFDGNEVSNKSIPATSAGMSSLTFQSDSWDIGIYSIDVSLFDEYGNADMSMNATSNFELLPMGPLVSGNIDAWLFDPSDLNLTLTGEHQFRYAQGFISLSNGEVMLLENYSVTNGVWSIELPLNSILQNTMSLLVKVCDATNSVECEEQQISIDGLPAIDYTVDYDCRGLSQPLLFNSTETLVSCTITHTNGTYPMQVSLTSLQASSFLQNTSALEELPIGGQLELSLLVSTGTEEGAWSQPWILSITNRIGEVAILQQTTTPFTITSDEEESNNEDEEVITTVESDSSSLPMLGGILVIFIIAALLGTLGFLKMKTKKQPLDDSKSFDSAVNAETGFITHTDALEDPTSSETPGTQVIQEIQGTQEIPVTPEATLQSSTPTLETLPTSTDEHGYEWYTESNGTNWYRLQGSGSEWYLHQG